MSWSVCSETFIICKVTEGGGTENKGNLVTKTIKERGERGLRERDKERRERRERERERDRE